MTEGVADLYETRLQAKISYLNTSVVVVGVVIFFGHSALLRRERSLSLVFENKGGGKLTYTKMGKKKRKSAKKTITAQPGNWPIFPSSFVSGNSVARL